jgi:hypothetical protein
MEESKILILLQLVRTLDENFLIFEKAYNTSDKEKFDSSKNAILDFQRKINFLIG